MKLVPTFDLSLDGKDSHTNIEITKVVTDVFAVREKIKKGRCRKATLWGVESMIFGHDLGGCRPSVCRHDDAEGFWQMCKSTEAQAAKRGECTAVPILSKCRVTLAEVGKLQALANKGYSQQGRVRTREQNRTSQDLPVRKVEKLKEERGWEAGKI